MARKGKRLAKGLRRHGASLQAYIRVNGELRTQTFPLDHPRLGITTWLDQQRRQRRSVRRGTLETRV